LKLAIDAGHAFNTAGKRTPDGEREWTFNNKVALALTEEINKYEGVQVIRLDDPTGNYDVPLLNRTNKANTEKADLLVSIHHNAFQGVWGTHGGTETIIWNGTYGSKSTTKSFATLVLNKILPAYGLRSRGVKEANLHMLRESNMTAVTIEGGFMDSTTDIVKLRDDNVLKNVGIAIAKAVAEFKGLKLKEVPKPVEPTPQPPTELYRIRKTWEDEKSQIGAYANLDSAISVALSSGYNVYNSKGVKLYPMELPIEPPLTQEELRKIRKLIN